MMLGTAGLGSPTRRGDNTSTVDEQFPSTHNELSSPVNLDASMECSQMLQLTPGTLNFQSMWHMLKAELHEMRRESREELQEMRREIRENPERDEERVRQANREMLEQMRKERAEEMATLCDSLERERTGSEATWRAEHESTRNSIQQLAAEQVGLHDRIETVAGEVSSTLGSWDRVESRNVTLENAVIDCKSELARQIRKFGELRSEVAIASKEGEKELREKVAREAEVYMAHGQRAGQGKDGESSWTAKHKTMVVARNLIRLFQTQTQTMSIITK